MEISKRDFELTTRAYREAYLKLKQHSAAYDRALDTFCDWRDIKADQDARVTVAFMIAEAGVQSPDWLYGREDRLPKASPAE